MQKWIARKFVLTQENFECPHEYFALKAKDGNCKDKSKQKVLFMKERFKILKAVDKKCGKPGGKSEVAKQFGIANSTLSTIPKD